MNSNDKKRVIIFSILTFSISWSFWLFSGVLFRNGFVYDSQWLFSQIGVFAPTIVAVILIGFKVKENRRKSAIIILLLFLVLIVGFIIKNNEPASIKEFSIFASISAFLLAAIIIFMISRHKYFYLPPIDSKIKNRIVAKWFLAALFFLPILFLVAWFIINFQGKELQISAFQGGFLKFIQILFLSFSMNLILGGSMGEEFGWRGYLLPILLKKYTPVGASIILGIIWATWHLPIDLASNYGFKPFIFLFRIIWTLPLAIVFTWFFIKTSGSILIALLLHTSVNMLPDLGFSNYESTILMTTLLLIIVSIFISLQPNMRIELKILR